MCQQTTNDRAKEIAEAIVVLLDHLEEHEQQRYTKRLECSNPFKVYTLDQLAEASERGDFFVEDPVGYGLRAAIRKAGKIAASQCPEQLVEIADRSAKKNGEWSQWRSFIIDKNFDGLTSEAGELLWVA